MVDKEDNNEDGDDMSLDKIAIVLENIESQNLKDDENVMNWLKQITSPEFKLIESFINLFLDSIQDHQLVATILKVLIKLNYYQKEIVQPQLQENSLLSKALINYLVNTEKSHLTGDPFMLLLQISNKNDYKNVKNKIKLVKQ